jgi:hypothetical protein
MKTRAGSTIGLVLIITLATGIVVASVVSLMNYQRRLAVSREIHFQANNMAETAIDYAFAFIANDVKRNSVTTSQYIPQAEKNKDFPFTDEAKAFLTGSVIGPDGAAVSTSNVTFTNLAVRTLQPSPTPTVYTVPATDPVNRLRAFAGQRVWERVVPVIGRATATYGATGQKFTAFIRKDIALDEVPMFQKAITYQGQLHLHRGYPMLGGVHTNGNLALNAHPGDTARYNGPVTCAGRFYRGSAFDQGGAGADPYGYCPEDGDSEFDFRKLYAENIKLAGTNTSSLTIITTDPTDATVIPKYTQVDTDFDSRKSNWKEQALSKFHNNLLDKSHQVPVLLPPGCDRYRLDDATTTAKNEFVNGTYKLLEPCIDDVDNPAYNPSNIYKFERSAALVFRVECLYPYKGTTVGNTTQHTYKWIVKAYSKMADSESRSGWVPLPMPTGVIGQTKVQTLSATNAQYEIATCLANYQSNGETYTNRKLEGLFEEYKINTTGEPIHVYAIDTTTGPARTTGTLSINGYVNVVPPGGYLAAQQMPAHGFFNARLGRGVSPITINMARLKEVLDGTDMTPEAVQFRKLLGVGMVGGNYNGVVYVEFPTSMRTVDLLSPRAYESGTTPFANDVTAIDSYAFEVGSTNEIELRHPDRMSDTDARADREDKILPIAKTLRGYPSSYGNSEIVKAQWAIPALQIVNGRKLPTVMGVTGLTISTNAPLYVVGSYNSDGNFATGTKITSTLPTDYAENDPGWGEVSAGLFADTLTILSDTWGLPSGTNGASANRFKRSFNGVSNYSIDNRRVTTGKVEISACILTGEYPIFEFFLHALEDWENFYSATNSPICIKGAVVGMFHSEIQHIKGAYGRDVNNDIQVYYHAHGAYAIPAVRLHRQLTNGIFPPGTPKARDYGQQAFSFLRPSTPADKAALSDADF